MNFSSGNVSLLVLGITSLALSRGMLLMIDDPEGPNLLIVGVFALVLFGMSLGVNYFHSGTFVVKGKTRVLVAIVVQIIVAAILYFFLK